MSQIKVKEVLNILLGNESFLNQYVRFKDELEIEVHAYGSLFEDFRLHIGQTDNYRRFYEGILNLWVDAAGRDATLQKLMDILEKEMKLKGLQEDLEDEFKDRLTGVIVRNNATATTSKLSKTNEPAIVAYITPQVKTTLEHDKKKWDMPSSSMKQGSCRQTVQPQGELSQDFPRGERFALIVNVLHDRPGTELDEIRLNDTLKRCGFIVRIAKKEDRTEKNLIEEIKKFRDIVAEHNERKPVGGIFVALMSHGHNNVMFQTEEGGLVSIERIIGEFSFVNSLRNVPKVFLINMCRGKEFILHKDSFNPEEPNELFDWETYWNQLFENSRSGDGNALQLQKAQTYSDEVGDGKLTWRRFYLGFSTTEGKLSYRDDYIGAWFVFDFCTVLLNKLDTRSPTPIATIFEETKVKVEEREGWLKNDPINFKRKQIPFHRPVGFEDHLKFKLPEA